MVPLDISDSPTDADRQALIEPLLETARQTVAIMVMSADGRTTSRGRVGPLTGPSDQWLLTRVREEASAVIIGARTLRAEGYGRLVDDDAERRRAAVGKEPQPHLYVLGRSLNGLEASDAFSSSQLDITVLLSGPEPPAGQLSRSVTCQRVGLLDDGRPDLEAAWQIIRNDYSTGLIVCEGGPTLLGMLAEQRRLNQLLLGISPRLEGGAGKRLIEHADAVRIDLALCAAVAIGGFVFLRYGQA
jgi:riboflavin biosynthesis pyrimidine reductase